MHTVLSFVSVTVGPRCLCRSVSSGVVTDLESSSGLHVDGRPVHCRHDVM